MTDDDTRLWHNEFPKCPHCGHDQQDPLDGWNGRDECWETECGECEKPYNVSMTTTVTFTTKKKGGA